MMSLMVAVFVPVALAMGLVAGAFASLEHDHVFEAAGSMTRGSVTRQIRNTARP